MGGKNIYPCTLVQDVATETRPAFPDSSKFLQVFRNQYFYKFATALEPRGLPENKQTLISGTYTSCFCPLLLLFSLTIPHPLKYSSLATCNRADITKQRCRDMSFIIVIIIVIIIVSTNQVSRLHLKTA